MCLCVGAIPTTPNIFITSFTTVFSAFTVGIVRAMATNTYSNIKEKMSMFKIFSLTLLGTAGVTVAWQG